MYSKRPTTALIKLSTLFVTLVALFALAALAGADSQEAAASTNSPFHSPLYAPPPPGGGDPDVVPIAPPPPGPVPSSSPSTCTPWDLVSSPSVDAFSDHQLRSIAAISPSDMWAVGYYGSIDPGLGCCNNTLVQHWDGTRWSVIPSPNPSDGLDNRLYGVSATSANDVWAVGFSGTGSLGSLRTLILHWDGAKWSIVPSPNVSTGRAGGTGSSLNVLYGVSAISADDVWAVGWSGNNDASQTLTLHWDGTRWSIVPSANSSLNVNRLYAVTAISPNDVWAVGSAETFNAPSNALALHWDGTSWSTARTPYTGSKSALYGIAAISGSDIWAVGTVETRPLTMRYDGTIWRAIESAVQVPGAMHWAVSARAANDVWAVGSQPGGAASRALIQHWNGTRWAQVDEAGTGASSALYGVAALYPDLAWSAGSYYNADGLQNQTLLERYSGPECRGFDLVDVGSGDYFYKPVEYLYSHDIISGYSDGTFRPYSNTTRAQLAKMIVLAEGWSIEMADGPHFTDVGPDHTFYSYIETAFSRGIISGYSDGTFRPDAPVTRGQLAKIIVLARGWNVSARTEAHFSDVPEGHVFFEYIEAAYGQDIISGYGEGTYRSAEGRLFRPDDRATRAQIAKIVHRATLTTPYTGKARGNVARMVVSDYRLPIKAGREANFSDVTPDSPYFGAVETLYNHRPACISGYADGSFRPTNLLTQGKLADLLQCVADW